MVLKKFFKGKRKIGLPDTLSRSLPSEFSSVFAGEFPPLTSRAKSPSDVLDFVGHPRCSILTGSCDDLPKSPLATASTCISQMQQQPVRPMPPVRRTSFYSYSYDDDQQRKGAAATPLTLVMPQPITAIPPTRDTVLRSTSKDKTLVSLKESGIGVEKEEQHQEHQEQQQQRKSDESPNGLTSCTTLQSLYQELESYRLEHQEWLRREREHQQNEEWMMMKLYDVQAQLDQLTAHTDDARNQRILDYGVSEDDDSSGYVSDQDDDEGEEDWGDDGDPVSDHRRYYYPSVRHPRPPTPYRRRHNQHIHNPQHHQLPWPSFMVPGSFYRHPYRHSHNPLPPSLAPPLPIHPQYSPYPRYMYAESWPPIRRHKSSDGSLPSVGKKSSIRRSNSTDRFRSRRMPELI
ncbi:hypothetical protein BX666DRAFT_1913932 [Dichotomocladium elegans]|nr:hypothetical protein BX666DRAFT_1913932 [Dichotomocladium elegans]